MIDLGDCILQVVVHLVQMQSPNDITRSALGTGGGQLGPLVVGQDRLGLVGRIEHGRQARGEPPASVVQRGRSGVAGLGADLATLGVPVVGQVEVQGLAGGAVAALDVAQAELRLQARVAVL